MMNTKNMRLYQDRLLHLRKRLQGDVNQIAGAALKATSSEIYGEISMSPMHRTDRDTDTFDLEFMLHLVKNEDGMLEQINAALKRMKNGCYGVCAECKTKIPQTRLSAIPYALHCVKCASHLELHSANSLQS
jgi:RNA polymerase-binding transcription factor DksA